MYTSDECTAPPSLFAWSRNARPVRLVVAAPRPVPHAVQDDQPDLIWEGVDDVLFGFSVTALLLSPLGLVAYALLS